MKAVSEFVKAANRLSHQDRLKIAFELTKDYDGQVVEALAEAWAEDVLEMVKSVAGKAGIDGVLKNGRTLQVKSKKHGAHPDSRTYVTLSKSTLDEADDLLIAFVDYENCCVKRVLGPVAISSLKRREPSGRYVVTDMPCEILCAADYKKAKNSKAIDAVGN